MPDAPVDLLVPGAGRLDELHAWVGVRRSGAEGLLCTEFPFLPGVHKRMTLLAARREVAERLRPMAEQEVAASRWDRDPVVALRLDAFRAERAELRARLDAAVAALDAAPDPARAELTRREAAALLDANRRAWVILTAGRDPDSRRRPAERDS